MYERFEKLLKEKGLKAADVSAATGIGRSTFSDWKSGRSRPKHEKLVKIANALGTTPEYLMGSDDEKEGNLKGVIIGFGEEQKPIEITKAEYDAIKSILNTMRKEK